jgi:hypothetical protein
MTERDGLEQYRERVRAALSCIGPLSENGLILGPGDLPPLDTALTSTSLRALVGQKFYVHNEPCTLVEFVGTPHAIEGLAYVILAVLLGPQNCSAVIALDPAWRVAAPSHLSDLRHIRVSASQQEFGGLTQHAIRFQYRPEERGRHPLATSRWSVPPRPHLHVSGFDDVVAGPEERDTLHGFGSAWGSAALATALLDICDDEARCDEYDLEGAYGFGGVAPGSAELKIWLPGSVGWELYPPDA